MAGRLTRGSTSRFMTERFERVRSAHWGSAEAVAYLRGLKIYPLAQEAAPPPIQYIDLSGKPFNGIAAHD
jgi:hypothetical protein